MGPKVQIEVASAGIGEATLTLLGPIASGSGISIFTNQGPGAERLSASGISIKPAASHPGNKILEIQWLEVANLKFGKFQVEGMSGNIQDYTVTFNGQITVSPVQILP